MIINGVPPAARLLSALAFALTATAPLAAQEGGLGPRAVEIVEAARSSQAPVVALTGELAARVQSDLGFRIQGRVAERSVEVGDRVAAGQILARLENAQQLAEVASQQAGVAAMATPTTTRPRPSAAPHRTSWACSSRAAAPCCPTRLTCT